MGERNARGVPLLTPLVAARIAAEAWSAWRDREAGTEGRGGAPRRPLWCRRAPVRRGAAYAKGAGTRINER